MEEVKKDKSWEGKKKFFKDGDPNVHRGFNFWTWKRMTDNEKAAWTEFSAVQKAPIPKEVIEFKEKEAEKAVVIPDYLEDKDIEVSEITTIEVVRAELKKLGIKFAYNSKLETLQKKLADATNPE